MRAESVADRLKDGVARDVDLRMVSVATLANDRLDFFKSGSFGSPDARDVVGGFIAFRFGGEVCAGPPNFLLIISACSGRRFM